MRRVHLFYFLGMIFCIISCFEESSLKLDQKKSFVRYLGVDGNQKAADFELLEDGNIIILYNSEEESGEKDFYISKFSREGIEIWTRNLGQSSRAEVAKDIVEVPGSAGGFGFVIGYDVIESPTLTTMAVMVTTPEGNMLKDIVAPYVGFNDQLKTVTYNTNDGGLIVTGNNQNLNNPRKSVISRVRPISDNNFGFYAQNEPWGRIDFGGGQDEDMIALFVNNSVTGNDAYHWFMTTNEQGNGSNDFNFYTAALDEAGQVSNGTILPNEETDVTDDFLNFVLKEPELSTPNVYSLVGTSTNGTSSKIQVVKIDFANIVSNPSAPQTRKVIGLNGNYRGIGLTKIPGGYWILAEKLNENIGEVISNFSIVKVNDLFDPLENVKDFESEFNVNPIKIISDNEQSLFVLSTSTLGNQQKVQLIKLNRQGQFSE